MEIDYIIFIKVKDSTWYEIANEYGGVEEFEEWDDSRTPRYRREVGFKFSFGVSEIKEQVSTSHSLQLLNSNNEVMEIELFGLRLISFKGVSQTADVVISESLLDQVFIEDKSRSKVYVYCYLKGDTSCFEVSNNIWLSEDHMELLSKQVGSDFSFIVPEFIQIISGGILS